MSSHSLQCPHHMAQMKWFVYSMDSSLWAGIFGKCGSACNVLESFDLFDLISLERYNLEHHQSLITGDDDSVDYHESYRTAGFPVCMEISSSFKVRRLNVMLIY